MTETREKTLCAWCGEPIDRLRTRYNGEYICHKCYELHKRVRTTSSKFWKGVKKNVWNGE